MKKLISLTAIFLLSNSINAFALDFLFEKERNHIEVVGSSTISPLMAGVSEEFKRTQSIGRSRIKTPVVKSTGTGAGFKLFCQGIGYEYPDFTNASRSISFSERKRCNQNGIHEILEMKIGYDGIIFGKSTKSPTVSFTTRQIFLALAEKIYDEDTRTLIANPYTHWNQIDKTLPNKKITIFGPPQSSGTRDVFIDLVMKKTCFSDKNLVALHEDETELANQCAKIREDGVFVDSGENDDLIIKHLSENINSFGIFGYNFLIANRNKVKAAKIDNIYPSRRTISKKQYSLSRPLYIYFKKEHLKLIPKVRSFILEIIDKETIQKRGYLIYNGLVPLDKNEYKIMREKTLLQLEG